MSVNNDSSIFMSRFSDDSFGFVRMLTLLETQLTEQWEQSHFEKNVASFMKRYADVFARAVKRTYGSSGIEPLVKLLTDFFDHMLVGDNFTSFTALGLAQLLDAGTMDVNSVEMFCGDMRHLLARSHVFHFDERVIRLLELTNNRLHARKLPYRSMFIDADFTIEGVKYFGILIVAGKRIDRLLFDSFYVPENYDCTHLLTFGYDREKNMIRHIYVTLDGTGYFDKDNTFHPPTKEIDQFAMLAVNVLDFLNDPRIEVVKANQCGDRRFRGQRESYRSRGLNEEHISFVRISDPLWKYIETVNRLGKLQGYSHRFWVRGHFRTLHAPRYKMNVGTRLWIEPFIKGKGVLIQKRYEVDERDKGSHRGVQHDVAQILLEQKGGA